MPRTFTEYGPRIQEFLIRACNEGVDLDDPLATRLIRNGHTRAQLLEAAGLVHKRTSKKGRISWRATDTGRGIAAEHVPLFLNRRCFPSYTRKHWQAVRNEPEVMDAA